MNILPAIDLRHGKVVQLVGGDPQHVAVRAENSPAGQAEAWRKQGATGLHVVDLDAAFGEPNQWPHVNAIRSVGLPVQFGGGVRKMTQVQQLLDLGVDRVIVGTHGVRHPEWLRELTTLYPGRIILAVDARGRDVVVKGWTQTTGLDVVDLVGRLDDAALAGFLYTNVEKEGRLQGIDIDVVQEIRQAAKVTPIIVSGGISTMDDLDRLAAAGVDAVVLGMSVYTGAIELRQAVDRFSEAA